MDTLFVAMPELDAYKLALIGLAILCLIPLIQSFLAAPLAFIKDEQQPGMPIKGDHSLFSFRVLRTYSNSVENLPAMGLAVVMAIMLSVSASLVNWLVIIHLLARLAFWFFYYSGIGKVAGGPRTMSYVVGLLSNIMLVGAIIYVLI